MEHQNKGSSVPLQPGIQRGGNGNTGVGLGYPGRALFTAPHGRQLKREAMSDPQSLGESNNPDQQARLH